MDFMAFLASAQLHGYANGNDTNRIDLAKSGKEFVHRENEYESRDRYYGHDPFVGQRIVWNKTKPCWAMNYYGHVFSSSKVPTEEIYEFLREALIANKSKEFPLRGPRNFKRGDFSYCNHIGSKDNIENFKGVEEVLYKGEVVYKLIYHGGYVGTKEDDNA